MSVLANFLFMKCICFSGWYLLPCFAFTICFLLIQQEIENFKKLNLINKDECVSLAPETADPTQEVPPRPTGLQKGKYESICFLKISVIKNKSVGVFTLSACAVF